MDYKGFKIGTGAYALLVGGKVEQTLRDVGKGPVKAACPEPAFKYWMSGRLYEVPAKGGLRGIISAVSRNESEAERMLAAIKTAFRWNLPSNSITCKEWLSQFTDNEGIHSIIEVLVRNLLSVNLDEAPAGEAMGVVKNSPAQPLGFPIGGMKKVMDALAEAVLENGGEIWTKAKAKKIYVSDNVARGVLVEAEDKEVEIEAKVVISDASPLNTIELAGADNFDVGYLRKVRELVKSTPGLETIIVSKKPLMDFNGILNVAGSRRVCNIAAITQSCPEATSDGRHYYLVLQTVGSWLKPMEVEKELDLAMEDIKEIFPTFPRQGEVLMARAFHGGWPISYALPGSNPGVKTSIENLYNVGDGALPHYYCGMEGSAESGRIAFEDVIQRIKLSYPN